jgi:hypothetical protein
MCQAHSFQAWNFIGVGTVSAHYDELTDKGAQPRFGSEQSLTPHLNAGASDTVSAVKVAEQPWR